MEKLVKDSLPVKAHLKPDGAIEWTPRDTMLFKKLATPLTRAFLVKLYRCRQTLEDLPSRFLTFPIYTETFKSTQSCLEGTCMDPVGTNGFSGDVEMMDFVNRVEEVWRPLMRPVPNPKSQMEACLWELLDEL